MPTKRKSKGPRAVTRSVAYHNDPSSKQHAKDKAEALERRKLGFSKTLSFEVFPEIFKGPGNGLVQGLFKTPSKGFCLLRDPKTRKLRRVEGAEYSRASYAESRRLKACRYFRKDRPDSKKGQIRYWPKGGLSSIVTTLPPWAMRMLERVPPSLLDTWLEELAVKQAILAESISGRPLFSGAIHKDTACLHWHLEFPATKEPTAEQEGIGEGYDKETFLHASDWLLGVDRIERAFPGLQHEEDLIKLRERLGERRVEHTINLQLTHLIDQEAASFIKEIGLEAVWREEKKNYRKAKARDLRTRVAQGQVKRDLREYSKTKIWPRSLEAMGWDYFSAMPKPLRKLVWDLKAIERIHRRPIRALRALGIQGQRVLEFFDPTPANVMDRIKTYGFI